MESMHQRTAPSATYVGVVSGMASYIDAAAIVTFGIAVVILQYTVGLEPTQVGLASGALTLGIAVGALVGGRIGDRIGRRPVFTATMALVALAAGAIIVADGFAAIFAGALVLGLAVGADLPVSLATIAETADDTNRGRLIGLTNILWIVGIVAGIGLASVLGDLGRPGAQLMMAHVGVVALAVLIARLRIPESQQWRAARASGAASDSGTLSFAALVRGRTGAAFIALLVFYALINLAANTGGQFGTYLLVNVAGLSVSHASLVGLISFPPSILAGIWFMRIADGPNRHRYFVVGSAITLAGLAVPTVFGYTVATAIVSIALAGFGGGFAGEAIMKLWTQESFPTLVRTSAQGAIIAGARVVAAGFAAITPALIAIGPRLLYGILFVLAAVGLSVAAIAFRPGRRLANGDAGGPVVAESAAVG